MLSWSRWLDQLCRDNNHNHKAPVGLFEMSNLTQLCVVDSTIHADNVDDDFTLLWFILYPDGCTR